MEKHNRATPSCLETTYFETAQAVLSAAKLPQAIPQVCVMSVLGQCEPHQHGFAALLPPGKLLDPQLSGVVRVASRCASVTRFRDRNSVSSGQPAQSSGRKISTSAERRSDCRIR